MKLMRAFRADAIFFCVLMLISLSAKPNPNPSIKILSLYPYSAETTANKLSSIFTYPQTRFINAVLEVDLRGFADERKLSIFLTVSSENGVITKKKEKYKLTEGAYKFDFPHVLDLKKLFGKKKLKLYAELDLKDAPTVTEETFFEVEGRALPKVRVEQFFLYPENWEYQDYFYVGSSFIANLFFVVEGLERGERIDIKVVGVVDDEGGFNIDPDSRHFLYDTLWEEGPGPRQDGRYAFIFHGRLPHYFYEFGRFEHPFTIHVYFQMEDEIIEKVRAHGEIRVIEPGPELETSEEVLRTIDIERFTKWRIRRIPDDYQIEDVPLF